jgi:hypothetical protein
MKKAQSGPVNLRFLLYFNMVGEVGLEPTKA